MSEEAQGYTISPDKADPRTASTLIVGSVGVILLLVVVVLLQVLFYRTAEAENYRKIISRQPEELRSVQAEHLGQLSGYRWVAREQGRVAIPIERAMELVVQENARGSGAAN